MSKAIRTNFFLMTVFDSCQRLVPVFNSKELFRDDACLSVALPDGRTGYVPAVTREYAATIYYWEGGLITGNIAEQLSPATPFSDLDYLGYSSLATVLACKPGGKLWRFASLPYPKRTQAKCTFRIRSAWQADGSSVYGYIFFYSYENSSDPLNALRVLFHVEVIDKNSDLPVKIGIPDEFDVGNIKGKSFRISHKEIGRSAIPMYADRFRFRVSCNISDDVRSTAVYDASQDRWGTNASGLEDIEEDLIFDYAEK